MIGFVLGLGLLALALATQGWWMCLIAGFALLNSFRGFQQALHTDIPSVTVDGIVGPVTWQALVSGMLSG